MSVDVAGFATLMEEARERSRAATGGGDVKAQLTELTGRVQLPATEFIGYEQTETMPRPQRLHLFRETGSGFEPADRAEVESRVAVAVEQTPFYAEMGGQVADTGVIQVVNGGRVRVDSVQKIGEVVFHLGQVVSPIQASPDAKVPVALAVEKDRRVRIMANHTVTHVMNHKLRDVLGDHVQQKGSLVDDTKLRFDYSHNSALTPDEIERIEERVTRDIAADLPVYFENLPQAEALKINTLRAVFGEKYPPMVRVVSVGVPVKDLLAEPTNRDWMGYSVELCGGTHLRSTGEAEGFTIVADEAVAKGVRRITALTGAAAHRAEAEAERLLNRLGALKGSGDEKKLRDGIGEIARVMGERPMPVRLRSQLRQAITEAQAALKAIEKEKTRAASTDVAELARGLAETQGGDVIATRLDGVDANALRTAMDVLRSKRPDAALLLVSAAGEDKVAIVASVPEAKIKRGLKAGDWVREVAKIVGGGGGGRPDMAQAGGKDPAKIDEAIEAGRAFAASKL